MCVPLDLSHSSAYLVFSGSNEHTEAHKTWLFSVAWSKDFFLGENPRRWLRLTQPAPTASSLD